MASSGVSHKMAHAAAADSNTDAVSLPSATLETEILDPALDFQWDSLALSHPEANAFHTRAWARVLTSTYGHRPLYMKCSLGGAPAALIPLMEVNTLLTRRRGVSLPFSDFCEALAVRETPAQDIFAAVERLARERSWNYVEFRGDRFVPRSATPAVSFFAHKLDLRGGRDEIFARVRGSVRQALRKPRPSGLTVETTQSEEGLRKFFRLHAITRQRHGLPPQPLSFFLNIQREIIWRNMGFTVLVQLSGRPIAGMVFFKFGKSGIYKFGASDKRFQALRPNNLAMWEGIRSLSDAGIDTLHFGRSSLGNDGLRRFKLSWGASEESLHYYRYHASSGTWGATRDRTAGFHTSVFRRLPPLLNRLAGKLIYSHLD